jgi:glycerol-3-phosphate acyltransferase PlsY
MLWIIITICASYLLGSIPTAYIFGRLLKGIDIRDFGSGNVGATNALRVLGKPVGITVLIIDILKGVLAVALLGNLLSAKVSFLPPEILRVMSGLCAIAGHNWTIFLNFKGGKGVATTFGVLAGLAFNIPGLKLILILTIATWLTVFIIARIISVASVISAIAMPVYMLVFKQSGILLFLSIILCLFIILRHKPNIKRVLRGKEPRLKFGKPN